MFVICVKLTFLLSVRLGKAAYVVNHTFFWDECRAGTVLAFGVCAVVPGAIHV